jgi:hypothetical protein
MLFLFAYREGRLASNGATSNQSAVSVRVSRVEGRHQDAATATRQLDVVFASRSLAHTVSVCALNRVDEWGESDHCRILIDVDL